MSEFLSVVTYAAYAAMLVLCVLAPHVAKTSFYKEKNRLEKIVLESRYLPLRQSRAEMQLALYYDRGTRLVGAVVARTMQIVAVVIIIAAAKDYFS